jgi:hypothetical protein
MRDLQIQPAETFLFPGISGSGITGKILATTLPVGDNGNRVSGVPLLWFIVNISLHEYITTSRFSCRGAC